MEPLVHLRVPSRYLSSPSESPSPVPCSLDAASRLVLHTCSALRQPRLVLDNLNASQAFGQQKSALVRNHSVAR